MSQREKPILPTRQLKNKAVGQKKNYVSKPQCLYNVNLGPSSGRLYSLNMVKVGR